MKKLLITIDGPAGAGKTTVSRMLSKRLGYIYVDTGALYRGVALAAINAGVSADDEDSLRILCETLDLKFELKGNDLRLMSNGDDITGLLRTPEVTMAASAVSARKVVRDFLLDLQRRLGKDKCAVFEGRDMGTVVFPEADLKFYLDADVEARARRRHLEVRDDTSQTLTDIENDIRKRDENDSTRDIAPLKPAEDAIRINSTPMSAAEVVEHMMAHIDKIDETQ